MAPGPRTKRASGASGSAAHDEGKWAEDDEGKLAEDDEGKWAEDDDDDEGTLAEDDERTHAGARRWAQTKVKGVGWYKNAKGDWKFRGVKRRGGVRSKWR